MDTREPATTEALIADAVAPTPWAEARGLVEGASATYWLATMRPSGSPHVMPILGVWADGGLFFSAGKSTRKARNIADDPHCVITVEEEPIDLVVEGKAVMVRDEATLRRVADAYSATYGWNVTVRDGAFHDAEGAPTAGPPPYDVYEITPTVAFGFGTDETVTPTRWRFE
jgi:nitroimidazol reductase NimA-like FMN-containing flavoprotein (pyridoxamine 5'-phosphate oxidase superfamily)